MEERDSKLGISRHSLNECRARASPRAGFGVAPVLYLLGLIGVGAGVLFSGYSQSIKNNVNISNGLAVKNDLDSAATTLAATSVLGETDPSVLCPPTGGGASANCTGSGNLPTKMVEFYPTVNVTTSDPHLPSGYAAAVNLSSPPVEAGVFSAAAGVKQIDPWGHYYVYCRWETAANSTTNPAVEIISAGPDGILQTKCGATTPSGDDQIIEMNAATAVNRSAVWQTGTAGGNPDVYYGTPGHQLTIDDQGNVTVPGNISVGGSYNGGTAGTGTLSGNFQGGTVAGTTGSFTDTFSAESGAFNVNAGGNFTASNGAFAVNPSGAVTAAGGNFGIGTDGTLTIGTSTFTIAGSSGNTAIAGTLGVTGTTTLGTSGASTTPSLITYGPVNIGTTMRSGGTSQPMLSVGTPLPGTPATYPFYVDQNGLVSASTVNASTFNGSLQGGTVSASSITDSGALTAGTATISGVVSLGATTVNGNLTVTGTINGTINVSGTGGTTITGVLPLAYGGTGVNASSDSDLLNQLGITSSGYLNLALLSSGYIPGGDLQSGSVTATQLNSTGVTAGAYNWGTVTSDGRVVFAQNVAASNAIVDGNGNSVAVNNLSGTNQIDFSVNNVQVGIWTSTGLGIGTTTPGAPLDINGNVRIEDAAGQGSPNQLQLMTGATSERWAVTTDGVSESGTSTGSDFVLQSYNNSGTLIGNPFTLTRSGNATFAGTVTSTEFFGSGAGLTNVNISSLTGVLGEPNGGTGSNTTFTQGSVVFAGASSYAQDNANFFWNDSTLRLGIGTNAPASAIETYNGEVQVGSSGVACAATNAGALRYSGGSAYVCDGTNWDVFGGATGGNNYLGTSVTTPNPKASATDTQTGFYTAGTGKVDVTSTGTQIAEFNANGFNVVTGNIGIGSAAPIVSLDISQRKDAVALPVGTSGDRPTGGAVANGEIRYNSANPGVEAYVNGAWVSLLGGSNGALGVPNGGTGDTTLTLNGVLYGQGTNPIAETTAPLQYNVLVGNAGGVPVFGQVNLASNAAVTGILGTANGGTGTTTTFTQGSIVFAGAGGAFSQDNGNFFWDDTNHYLGIGTATPAASLDVNGDIRSGNSFAHSLTRALPTTVGSYVELGNFTFTNGGGSLWVSVTVPSANYSVAKEYLIPIQYNQTNNVWATAQAISSTGQYFGTDFALDVNVNNQTAYLRLRNVKGTTAGTAYVEIKQEGVNTDAFTATSATGSYTPTAFLSSTVLTQVGGAVGIGTTAPETPLEVVSNVPSGFAPTLRLVNLGGGAGSSVAIDLSSYDVGAGNQPTARVSATDVGYFTNDVSILTNRPYSNPPNLDTHFTVQGVTGNVVVDASDENNGTASAFLSFGGGGEGIASNRISTPNQYGLDFYTSSTNRMVITNGGNVGIGTTNPASNLDVRGSTAGGYVVSGISSGSGSSVAVYGSNTGSANTGVGGLFVNSSTDTTYSAAGVSGLMSGAGNNGSGVYGSNTGSSNTGTAGYFKNTSAAAGIGALAQESGASNTGYAMQVVNNSPSGWGLYSSGTSPNYFAGSVGIGTTTPNSLLQAYNGEVQVGSSGATCSAAKAGALRYAGGSAYVCDGTNWDIFGGAGGGALPALPNGDIWVGNASNAATAVVLSQDVTITNTGVATLGKIQNVAVGSPTGTAGTAVVLANSPTLTGTVSAVNVTMSGEESLTLGADYTTTGVQSDVNLGTASAVRYNGSGAATFRGIVAGTNGEILYLHNASNSTLTLSDVSDSIDLTAANKIITGTGNDLPIPTNTSVTLQYDATSAKWRVTGSSNSAKVLAAGSDENVQFNKNGVMGGDADFIWDYTNHRLGLGAATAPLNTLDITGGMAIGATYAGVDVAPANGLLVQGNVGIGTASPISKLQVTSFAMGSNLGNFYNSGAGAYSPSYIGFNAARSESGLNWTTGNDSANDGAAAISGDIFGGVHFYNMVSVGTTNQTLTDAQVVAKQTMVITGGGNVGIGTTSPDASLDLSQKTDAVSLPVGTTGNRPTAVNGMIRYNTTLPGLEAYINGVWSTLQSSGATSGILGVPNGGTGDNTLTAHSVMLGEGTSAVGTAGPGNQYTVLVGNGVTTDPSFSASPTLSGVLTDLQSIGVTSTDGIVLQNTTAAAAGAQQWSPRIHFSGKGWKTTATAASQAVDMIEELQPVQGAANPTGNLTWSSSINGGAYSALMTLTSGGNVGIGTANPVTSLDIENNSTGTQTLNLGNASSNQFVPLMVGLTPNLTAGQAGFLEIGKALNANNAASLEFTYAGNGSTSNRLDEYFYGSAPLTSLLASGNFGIGTTTPQSKLDVYGGVSIGTSYAGITAAPTNGAIIQGNVGIGTTAPDTLLSLGSATASIKLAVYDAGSGALFGIGAVSGNLTFGANIAANGTPQMVLQQNTGNVGIGTTSPAQALDVYTAGNARIQVDSGSTSFYPLVLFSQGGVAKFETGVTGTVDASGGGNYYINPTPNSGALGAAFFVKSNGNVGIGTTAPNSTLSISGSASTSYTTQAGFGGTKWRMQQTSGDEGNAGVIDYRGFDAQGFNIVGAGTSGSNRIVHIYDNLSVGYSLSAGGLTGGQAVFSGNVGIGTTTPGALMQIVNGATANTGGQEALRLSAVDGAATVGSGPYINFTDLSNNSIGFVKSSTEAAAQVGLAFGTYNSGVGERMRISAAGNVGIGTTSPAALLHLSGNQSAAAWTTNGIGFRQDAATYTDTSSSGTVASNYVDVINAPTLAATSATTYTNAATLYIAGSPAAGMNATIGQTYALRVGSGYTRFDGTYNLFGGATNLTSIVAIGGNHTATSWTTVGQNLGVVANTLTDNTGSGTIATRAANSFAQPTFASQINAETLTNAATLYIDNAPAAGTNTTITNPLALDVAAGTSYFGGNVGIGTASPSALLEVGTGASTGKAVVFSQDHAFGQLQIGNPATNGEASIGFFSGNTVANASDGLTGGTFWVAGVGSYSSGSSFVIGSGSATNGILITTAGNVGIGSTSPVASLDLSQKTDAVSLPVGTTGTRPSGVNGMIRYNTALPGLEAYVNGVWSTLQSSGTTSGVLGVPNGGTGDSSLTAHGVIVGEGTSPLAATSAGAIDTVFVGNGASADPTFSASPTLSGTITDLQSIGAVSTDGMLLQNTTAAATGAQQWSPRVHFSGQGWKTTASAASQAVDMIMELQPVQGTTNPIGNLTWSSSVNGAAYSPLMTLTSGGNVGIGTTSPTRALDVAANVTYSGGGLASQLSLRSPSAPTYKLNLGYDTTNNFGFIEAVHESLTWENLILQPSGGNVAIGGSGNNYFAPGSSLEISNADTTTGNWAAHHSMQLSTGHTTSDYTLYAGADSTNHDGFIQAANYGVGYANLLLNANGGNVGIGTTSPGSALDVYGDNKYIDARAATTAGSSSVGAFGSDYYSGPTYTATYLQQSSSATAGTTLGISNANMGALTFQNTANALIYTNGQTPLIFGTYNNERMRITSAGNVGIGTTSPVTALNVNGAISTLGGDAFYNGVYYNGSNWQYTGAGSAVFALRRTGANGFEFRTFADGTAGSNAGAGNSALAFATNTGYIGIGSTSPVASLDLSQKTDAVSLPVGTTGTRPSGVNGMIRYNTALPGLEAYVNGVWSTLQSSGTTSGVLGVPNGGTGDSSLTAHGVIVGEGTSPLAATSAGAIDTVFVGNGASADPTFSASPTLSGTITDLQSIGAVSTDGMLLQNTTAAATGAQQWSPRVHFSGQGWKTTASAASQAVDMIMELQPVQGTTNPSGNLTWSSSVNGAAYSPLMTLTSGGNVGIGTTSPAANTKLDVRGRIATATTDFTQGSVGSQFVMDLGATTGNTYSILQAYTAGETATGNLALNPTGGNVGIGTASPPYQLSVFSGNTGSGGVSEFVDPSMSAGSTAWNEFGQSNTQGNAAEIAFYYAGNNSASNRVGLGFPGNGSLLNILQSGNVGIGTAAPTSPLHVYTAAAGTDVARFDTASGATAGVIMDVPSGNFLRITPDAGAGAYNPIVQNHDTSLTFSAGTSGSGNLVIAPWSGSLAGLRMTSSGSVGIGTASPKNTLHVNGRATIDDGSGSGYMLLYGNSYYTGSQDDYLNNGYAGRLFFNGTTGVWQVQTSASGTAGSLAVLDAAHTPLTILQNGSVGIGTTAPAELLTVGSGASQYFYVNTNNGANTPPVAGFGLKVGTNITNGAGEVNFWNPYQSATTAFDFRQRNGAGAYAYGTLMSILSNGAVGIGTTAPTSHSAGYTVLGLNGSGGGLVSFETAGVEAADIYDSSNNLVISSYGGGVGTMNLLTGANTGITIGSTGLVGIGSTSPVSHLDLSQATDAIALPVGTTTNRPTGVNGMIRYNSGLPGVEAYVNGSWSTLQAGGSTGTTTGVANGGTGDTTLTAHSIMLGEGTSPVGTAGPGAVNTVLIGNGASTDPSFSAAPTLSGTLTDLQSIGATSTDGMVLQNTTAATVSLNQWSPRLHFSGQGWKTTSTAASQAVDMIEELQPVQGTSAPTGNLTWSSSVAGGSYSSLMTLTSGGYVGIGTGSPAGTLDVEGGTAVASTNGSSINLVAQSAGTGNKNGGNIILTPGVATGTGMPGGVGIGTTSPANPLHVVGGISASGPGAYAASGAGPAISMYESSSTGNITAANSGVGFNPMILNAQTFSLLSNATTQGLYQNTSGLVGIGTTSVADKLDIAGGLGLTATTATVPGTGIYAPSANTMSLTTSGVPAVTINSSGYVGVGSTTPSSALDIYGNTGGLTIQYNSFSYPVIMQDSGGSEFSITDASSTFVMDSCGNFGLDMTPVCSNNAQLELAGKVYPGGILRLDGGDGATNYTNAQIAFGYNGTSQYPQWIHTRHNTAATNNAFDFYTDDGTANGVFPTNAVLGLSINNGQVGIGTTAPGQTLSVYNGSSNNYQIDFGYSPIFSWVLGRVGSGSTNSNFNLGYTAGSTTVNNVLTATVAGNVGIGSTTPDASLDLSQKTDAVSLPVGTTGSRPGTGVNGMIRYNSALPGLEAYVNGAWDIIQSSGSTGGTLGVSSGGTGDTTLTAHSLMLGEGTSPVGTAGPGAVNTVLVGMGASADPTFSAAPTLSGTITDLQSIGVTSTDGVVLQNTTAAALGAQQWSPRLHYSGKGWETGTSASQAVDMITELQPVQGATNPTGNLTWSSSVNGAAYSPLMTLTSGGYVGIGTTAPTQTLDVRGTAYFSGTNYNGTYPTYQLAVGGSGLAIGWNGQGGYGETDFVSFPGAGSGGFDFVLANSSGVVTSTPMVIHGGNVGIGTTNPTLPLQVQGNELLANASAGSGVGPSLYFGRNSETYSQIEDTGLNLTFFPGGTQTLTMLSSGNVGIGTTSPNYPLTVYEANSSSGIALINGSSSTAQYPSIGVSNYAAATGGFGLFNFFAARGSYTVPAALQSGDYIGGIVGSGYGASAADSNAAAIDFIADGTFTNTNGPASIAFYTTPSGSANALAERMRINSAGNVGIGTSSPATGAKLDVAGPIKVAGTGSESCSASTVGMMRYNSTAGYMEICQ